MTKKHLANTEIVHSVSLAETSEYWWHHDTHVINTTA